MILGMEFYMNSFFIASDEIVFYAVCSAIIIIYLFLFGVAYFVIKKGKGEK